MINPSFPIRYTEQGEKNGGYCDCKFAKFID